jgi:TonB family protein
MTVTTMGGDRAFKRAVIISAVLHAALFIVMVTSPSLPKPARKGMIHYVSMSAGLPGGGGAGGPGGPGGGGGGPSVRAADEPQPLPPAKKETLRDLTTLQKIQPQESDTALRYPVEKPKRDRKPQEKKAVISKAPPDAKADRTDAAAAAAAGTGGTGSGLRIGVGDGTGGGGGGGGFGPGFGGGGGTGFFPHAYYVQIVYDRVSASWFTALVDPGVSGSFSAQVTFRIFRNGRISDLKISESSGLPSLDLSALRAIQTAAPFPPLPNDYDGEYLVFHIIFEHNK